MDGEASQSPLDPLRRLTLPVGLVVAGVVGVAWYVLWVTSDFSMSLLMASPAEMAPLDLSLFLLLIVVMMVAMMLPSALPMLLAYRDMTRLEKGQAVRSPDNVATTVFASAYFVVWGAFGFLALLGLMAVGLAGPVSGPLLLVPGAVLVAAGGYQFTRTKQACLEQCRSPFGFALSHWREGRSGAWRMGLEHSVYCMGCCWLFMVALFVTGAMSLVWMGGLSLAIFVEKAEPRGLLASRVIAVLLIALGILVLVPGLEAL